MSEGRGTTRPFEMVGAPWHRPERFGRALERARTCPASIFRPTVFEPTFQKHGGKSCGGVQMHVRIGTPSAGEGRPSRCVKIA